MKKMNSNWLKSGTPWIWLTGGAVAVSLVMVIGLLFLIAIRGLGQFWPTEIISFEYKQGDQTKTLLGEVADQETVQRERLQALGIKVPGEEEWITRYLLKIGNRDQGHPDFVWVEKLLMGDVSTPPDACVIERDEWGNFYGYLQSFSDQNTTVKGQDLWKRVQKSIARRLELSRQIKEIEKHQIGKINAQVEQLRLEKRRLELDNVTDEAAYTEIKRRRSLLDKKYQSLQRTLADLYQKVKRDSIVVMTSDGKEVTLPIAKVRRIYQPNRMSTLDKIGFYFTKMEEFITDDPREANTEGGIFPAIFGTALMVMLMSIIVTPFGVIAAVYLHEYAKKGPLTRTIRIAVNNLAGVPSIVYGVFGLGFFVYLIGGRVDQIFFPEALPAPTFGTPGLLWSSLTLALLTLPVVIIATEEGLSRIPRTIREGSLALGATKAETLWRTVLPMTTPAMMTGLILAVARAAGEVAPLMMVGVVKLAPSLPIDDNYPFLHLDRKFMHLGFHIYDVGFQSPNVEAARPLVYATAFVLVVLIVALNLLAIKIRNRLREKYITQAQ